MSRMRRRDAVKESVWRRRIQGQAGSGLSVRAWCRQNGVGEPSFHWWRRELARRDAESPTFVPVRVTTGLRPSNRSAAPDGSEPAGRIEIVLEDGRRIRLHGHVSRQRLDMVLAALESRPC